MFQNYRTATSNLTRGTTGGLRNMGNTCFLNSIVQALYHIQRVVHYLENDCVRVHMPKCVDLAVRNCTLCALKKTYDQSLHSAEIEPTLLVNNLSVICSRMKLGFQQDAHEFLRYVSLLNHNHFLCISKIIIFYYKPILFHAGGFHLHLFKLAFINQLYSWMTRLVRLSLAIE